jgi:DinB superfamily
MDDILRYPIGKFTSQESHTSEEIGHFISRIESFPEKLESAIQGLSTQQLDTPYRDGGWTVRQVIHHLADSHMHAYIRFKWTLTEDSPVIKAYREKLWAETPEMKADPIISLNLLKALHTKWIILLRQLSANDLQKEFIHPETQKRIRLHNLMGTYAWHGEHHLAHITSLKKRMNWQ